MIKDSPGIWESYPKDRLVLVYDNQDNFPLLECGSRADIASKPFSDPQFHSCVCFWQSLPCSNALVRPSAKRYVSILIPCVGSVCVVILQKSFGQIFLHSLANDLSLSLVWAQDRWTPYRQAHLPCSWEPKLLSLSSQDFQHMCTATILILN